MNITFCGHRDYFYNSLLEDTLTNILNDFAQKNQTVCCFNGGYGEFDRLAYRCTRRAKLSKSNIKNYLVIPYLLNKDIQCEYDEVIYPPLENSYIIFLKIRINKLTYGDVISFGYNIEKDMP